MKLKRVMAFILAALMLLSIAGSLAGCSKESENKTENTEETTVAEGSVPTAESMFDGTVIKLSDEGITVDGEAISEDEDSAVYAAKDIVFYLEGQDFTYGEGSEEDAHSQEEADKHTVVHITEPGNYQLSGSLSAGQIAVDLGDDAETDPDAVVTLYLNGVDITCTVAPAVIFYNVYECGSTDTESATYEVDTSAAGANVYIMDNTENNINGAYVARIYKSVTLSEDGKTILEAKKLHKYDAAFYSKMSMNVDGDSGVLNIYAANEGLDSELHLTINGGNINITAGNDGINTNEDSVSVTTINGGNVNIAVNGDTGEGDGIDSNGWLVINGGTVLAQAYGQSEDSGIDSDMGIYVNGGCVMATGNMYDRLEEGGQNYAVFSFAEKQSGGNTYSFRNESGEELFSVTPCNSFMYLILSDPGLVEGTYSLWMGDTQLAYSGNSMGMGGMGMMGEELPEGMTMPEGMTPPEGMQVPEGMTIPEGAPSGESGQMMKPEDLQDRGQMGENPFTKNEDGTYTLPDGSTVTEEELQQQMEQFRGENQRPDGMQGGFGQGDKGGFDQFGGENMGEASTEFVIQAGANLFSGISAVTEAN